MSELKSPGPLFGLQPLRVLATAGPAGTPARLDILYADGAAKSADDYAQMAEALRTALATASSSAAVPVPGIAQAIDFVGKEVRARLTLEPGKRLSVSLMAVVPAVAARQAPKKPETAKVAGKPDFTKRVKQLPNGDVVLTNLPEPTSFPSWLDRNGYAETFLWLQQYYGWQEGLHKTFPPREEIVPGKRFETYDAFLKHIIQTKCKRKLDSSHPFTADFVMQRINQGEPMIVYRMNSAERMNGLIEFALEFAKDPSIRLPDPNDPVVRKTWPTFNKKLGKDVHQGQQPCIIHGYNKDRGEVLFHDFFPSPPTALRMTMEEMQTSCRLLLVVE